MKTKIIATIGPASKEYSTLKKMVDSGLDIARINTKYGTPEEYDLLLTQLKKLKCKVLFDIKGTTFLFWLKKRKFDYLAVSFAESAKQIEALRKKIGFKVKIIAKIETKKGIKNVDELIRVSDGLMIARGDLGRNVLVERVPLFQKEIIKKCNAKKKFVVTATEMLLSMTKSKVPERAEVSDVANAILDGSDALMLSEETAIGKHPVLVVKMMERIIIETEKNKKRLKS